MGLFGSALDYLSGAFSHPIIAVTQGLTAAKDAFVTNENKGLSGRISNAINTIGTTTAAATAIVAGGAALGYSSATAIASKALPAIKAVASFVYNNPIKTAVAVGVVDLATKSNVAATQIVNTPSSVNNYLTNVGKTIDNPTISNVLTTVKENPVLAGLTGAAVTTAVGLGIGGAVSAYSNFANTQAVKANTKATEASLQQGAIDAGVPPEIAAMYHPNLSEPVNTVTSNMTPAVAASPLTTKAAAPAKKKKSKKKTTKKKTTKKKTTKKKTRRSKKKKSIKRRVTKK